MRDHYVQICEGLHLSKDLYDLGFERKDGRVTQGFRKNNYRIGRYIDRFGKNILITDLADWTQVFGEPTMTAALLDRLTHKAHIINCSWESYRLKQSLNQKATRI
ncbi:IstB-like ATP binding protein [Desulfomicrobium norvegicum]|uniref:IstB-like ATP binding protein n=1 Tax=Desulfomicrobium norvegicum (strain DSM 1741 / NCIMB 8310) TaxID=52561 RepID=A0A8G2C332_DESNO|nr:ATP-binding protein [Desulfomicrobium norvegicum]SFL76507.1 IstB-like ATP binding protein [Desulfomicrobium norvegicum]